MAETLTLNMTMEVTGCPTVCEHCWAQGKPYKPMPVVDIAWVLEQTQLFADKADLKFIAYPLHEALQHPDAARMLQLFKPVCNEQFEPLATNGIPLATRDDWEELLEVIRSLGTKYFWLSFHGLGEVHDQMVHRTGAYKEVCTAVKRIRSMDFRCGCNLFVHKRSLSQLDSLIADLEQIGVTSINWDIPFYYPTARSRRYDSLRPELTELLPHGDKPYGAHTFSSGKWADLQSYTEAAYVQQAMENSSDNEQDSVLNATYDPDYIGLVCRNNLDVHSGSAGLYGAFHGNLRKDGVGRVLEKAIEYGACSVDPLYFSVDRLPSIREVAQDFGDPKGQKIYFWPRSMHLRWLDLALAEHRRY